MRSCGDCIACCVFPSINDEKLVKPRLSHCPHVTLPGPEKENEVYYTGASEHNCSIHEQRPATCAAYTCAWRAGYGGDGDRPDKTLMLFELRPERPGVVIAKPLAPGHEQKSAAVIERMCASVGLPSRVVDFYSGDLVEVMP